MSIISLNNTISSIEQLKMGDKLLEEGSFFKELADLLDTPEFNVFLQKHMKNMEDIKCSMVYIKLYDAIKHKLPLEILEDAPLTKKLISVILYNFITNRNYRSQVIQTTLDHIDMGTNSNLIDAITKKILYENYLTKNLVTDPDLLIQIHKEEIKKLKKMKKHEDFVQDLRDSDLITQSLIPQSPPQVSLHPLKPPQPPSQ
mgnify:CR=1 FL=1